MIPSESMLECQSVSHMYLLHVKILPVALDDAFFHRELRGVVHEKLLTTQVEVANRDNHLKKVAERQKLAEEQIRRLEAELSEAKKRKEQEVRMYM